MAIEESGAAGAVDGCPDRSMTMRARPPQSTMSRATRERIVYAEVYTECPFSMAQDYATEFFKDAETGGEYAHVRVPLRLFGTALNHRVGLTFGIHSDDRDIGRAHDQIAFRWNAGTSLLPDFHGTVRFRIAAPGTHILVDGLYVAPLGSGGRLFDAIVGKRIANASVGDLARRISRYLEGRHLAWQVRISAARAW
jgi:hypothetical protein